MCSGLFDVVIFSIAIRVDILMVRLNYSSSMWFGKYSILPYFRLVGRLVGTSTVEDYLMPNYYIYIYI